jgi:hypothetical protein
MVDSVKAAAATTTMSIMTTMTKLEAAINELKRAKFEADEDEELEDVEQRLHDREGGGEDEHHQHR